MIPGHGWKAAISDPDEKLVFEALSDPHWDFRTIDGFQGNKAFPGTGNDSRSAGN
jgi:hypothetical protein